MLRALFFIIQLCVLAALVVAVSSHPGTVRVEWLDYTITVHIGLFLVALLLVIGAAVLVHRIYRGVVEFPEHMRRYSVFQAQNKGMLALSSGMNAVAAGDVHGARKYARKAQKYLPNDPALSLLLQAQTAGLEGRDDDARKVLLKLSDDKKAGFLGLRALLQKAMDDRDYDQARGLVNKAMGSHGKNPWVLQAGYDLALRSKDWGGAFRFLELLDKHNVLAVDVLRRDRLALLIARADADADRKRGLILLEGAYKLDPYFVPLLQRLVAVYLKMGQRKAAQKLLEKAWKQAALADLAALWMDVVPPKQAAKVMGRVQWAEKLVTLRPQQPESFLAVASVMLDEGLWGEARDHLMQAKGLYEVQGLAGSARLFALLATLERKQNADETAAQEWLVKGRIADVDPVWMCRETGRVYGTWSPVAEPHGAFNSMVWQVPASGFVAEVSAAAGADKMAGLLSV